MSEPVGPRRKKRTEHDVWMGAYNAGRLAGIREAAEVVAAVITIPGDEIRSDEMMVGIAKGARYTAERNKAAILALAEGTER